MRVRVVTPWYPDYVSPYSGIFVQKQVSALESLGVVVDVEYPHIFPAPPDAIPVEVWESLRALASADPGAAFSTEGNVTWIPAPVPSRSGSLGRAEAFARAISIKREFLPGSVDVTHAHLGIPTGLALLELGDSPLVVTEHQSTLGRVFGQPGAKDAYRRTIEAADAFFCVSEHLRQQIMGALGSEYGSRVGVIPNIVDLADIPFRERGTALGRHWIYVGTLALHKGIEAVLRSFRLFHKSVDKTARLALVGAGPHRPWVERFVAANGLGEFVDIHGAQTHRRVGALLDEADVMVHLSPSETFGIATLEAIGAGLPVVSVRNGGAENAWGEIEVKVGRLLPAGCTQMDVVNAVVDLRERWETLDPIGGRDLVDRLYSPSVVAQRLTEVYEACA